MLVLLLLNGSGMLQFVHITLEHDSRIAADGAEAGLNDLGSESGPSAHRPCSNAVWPAMMDDCPTCQLLTGLVAAQISPMITLQTAVCQGLCIAVTAQTPFTEGRVSRSTRAPPAG